MPEFDPASSLTPGYQVALLLVLRELLLRAVSSENNPAVHLEALQQALKVELARLGAREGRNGTVAVDFLFEAVKQKLVAAGRT